MKRFVGIFVFLWIGMNAVWAQYQPTAVDEALMERVVEMMDELSDDQLGEVGAFLEAVALRIDMESRKWRFFLEILRAVGSQLGVLDELVIQKSDSVWELKNSLLSELSEWNYKLLLNHIDPTIVDQEIVILEFTDLECPFCRRHHRDGTLQSVVERYPEVSYATMAFPLDFHPLARPASAALICIQQYAGYDAAAQYKDELFVDGLRSADDIQTTLRTLWLTSTEISRCVSWGDTLDAVDEQIRLGKLMWARGTPANIILHIPTRRYILISGAVGSERFDEPVQALLEGDRAYFANTSTTSPFPGSGWAPVPAPIRQADTVDRAEFLDTAYIQWNPDAPVSVIEFSDAQCPFCQKHTNAGTLDEVLETYGDQVNIIYGHFPLSFHPNAQKAGEAIECAGKLWWEEWFFAFKSALYAEWWDASIWVAKIAAETAGLDVDALVDCVESGEFAQQVQDSMVFGRSLGVTGTPGNIVLDTNTLQVTKISGAVPASAFDSAIKSVLHK